MLYPELKRDPPIPSQDAPVDKAKLEQWVAMHKPDLQPLAKKIGENIRYIDFDTFYKSLINCAQRLNQAYKDGNIKPEEVALIVPFLREQSLSFNYKSNAWVASLLLKHLDFVPAKIFQGKWTGRTDFEGANIKRILFMDDASYSGVDLSAVIYYQKDALRGIQSDIKIDLIVPYITHKALSKFQPLCDNIIHDQIMPTMDELPFTESEKQALNNYDISGYGEDVKIDRLTPTYFAHKMADNYSVPEKILRYGFPIDYEMPAVYEIENHPERFEKDRIQFIPDIDPCYKHQNPQKRLSDWKKPGDPVVVQYHGKRKSPASGVEDEQADAKKHEAKGKVDGHALPASLTL